MRCAGPNVAIHLARGGGYAGQSSPWWYDVPQFHELLSASGATPVRALIESLDGCAGGRAGEIVALAGLSRMACVRPRPGRGDAAPGGGAGGGQAGQSQAPGRDRPRRLPRLRPTRSPMGVRRSGRGCSALIPAVVEVWASKDQDNLAAVSVNRTPIAGEIGLQRDKSDVDLFGCGLAHTVAKAPKGQEFSALAQRHHALHADNLGRQGAGPHAVPARSSRKQSKKRPARFAGRAPAADRRRTWCSTISPR